MTTLTRILSVRPGCTAVRCGSAEVRIYHNRTTAGARFTLCYYVGQQRVRRNFASLDVAKIEARRAAALIQRGVAEALELSAPERESFVHATRQLASLQVPLVAAVEEYVACRAALNGAPLLPALEDYVRRSRGVRTGATVAELVPEFLAAKEQDGASQRYLYQLRSDLTRFAQAVPGPLLHVKSDQIDAWLRGLNLAPRTRNTVLTTIRTFFSWAKASSYLPKNELTEAEVVGKVKVGDTETEIFTPEDFEKVLLAAPLRLIPLLTIGAFAGLRAAELERLQWRAVNLGRGIIELRANQAKTASRRIVPISANLKAWLERVPREGRVVPDHDLYRQAIALSKKVGVPWPRNGLRHSYISYRLAEIQDAARVPATPPRSSLNITASW